MKNFITSSKKLFNYYKELGEKAIAQIDDQQIDWKPNEASHSIALIVHISAGTCCRASQIFSPATGRSRGEIARLNRGRISQQA